MNLLILALVFNFLGSIISLLGGVLLLARKEISKYSHFLSSFAAGTLLGAVFFDLLPEALHEAEETIGHEMVFLFVLVGIFIFFILERILHWLHHHSSDEHVIKGRPVVPLIISGDTIHNFIDGVAIAASFMVSIPLGIITTFAVGIHEIPQEIGDFGIMIKHGMKRRGIFLVNLLSSFASFVGVILTFYFGTLVEGLTIILLAVSAGFFLYISLSDLIPEIHHESRKRLAAIETFFLFLGVGVVYLTLVALTSYFQLPH